LTVDQRRERGKIKKTVVGPREKKKSGIKESKKFPTGRQQTRKDKQTDKGKREPKGKTTLNDRLTRAGEQNNGENQK